MPAVPAPCPTPAASTASRPSAFTYLLTLPHLQVHGTGRMWVAPRAEMDPSAVSIRAEGRDLAVEAVARRYMPEGVTPPPGMVVGRASLAATMQVGWGA